MLLDRYRCVDYATHLKCQARVFLEDGVFIPTGDHNHGNKEQYIYNLNFENALKSAAEAEGGALREIYNTILQR